MKLLPPEQINRLISLVYGDQKKAPDSTLERTLATAQAALARAKGNSKKAWEREVALLAKTVEEKHRQVKGKCSSSMRQRIEDVANTLLEGVEFPAESSAVLTFKRIVHTGTGPCQSKKWCNMDWGTDCPSARNTYNRCNFRGKYDFGKVQVELRKENGMWEVSFSKPIGYRGAWVHPHIELSNPNFYSGVCWGHYRGAKPYTLLARKRLTDALLVIHAFLSQSWCESPLHERPRGKKFRKTTKEA